MAKEREKYPKVSQSKLFQLNQWNYLLIYDIYREKDNSFWFWWDSCQGQLGKK